MATKDKAEEPQAEQVAGGEVTTTEVPGRRKVSGEYLVYQAPEGRDLGTNLVRAIDAYAVKYAAYPSKVYVSQEDVDTAEYADSVEGWTITMGDGIPVEIGDFVEPGTVACKIEHTEATAT